MKNSNGHKQAVADNSSPNIHQRMLAITADVKKHKEDGRVRAAKINYEYTSHNAVTEMLEPLFVKHGVNVVPSFISSEDIMIKCGDGMEKRIVKIEMSIDFVNVDNPGDNVPIKWISEAYGATDKAHGIAVSAGIRQCFQKTFKLVTGDPDIEESDNDVTDKEASQEKKTSDNGQSISKHEMTITDNQIYHFEKITKKYNWSEDSVIGLYENYGVDHHSKFRRIDFNNILATLEQGPNAFLIPGSVA